MKRLIELNRDSYIIEFVMEGLAKVSKKNSSQPLTIDEVILVLREYQLGKGKPIQQHLNPGTVRGAPGPCVVESAARRC